MKRRFLWTESLHLAFLASIFEIGLRSCTPKSLYDAMCTSLVHADTGLTSDHIKSHLQKFRNNSRASADAFKSAYVTAREAVEEKAGAAATS